LRRPTHHRLLMEGIQRIGEHLRLVAARLRPMVVRMKYDLRPLLHRRAHGLRISPPFVTDRDAELHAIDVEHTPPGSGREHVVFRRIELYLVLKSGERSVAIEYGRRDVSLTIG